MAGNLKNAVGGCVDDWFSARNMFIAKFGNDRCSRSVAIPKNAGQCGLIDQCVEQLLRKGFVLACEVAPLEQDRNTGNLPMPARRVLAAAEFGRVTVGADNFDVGIMAGRECAGALLACVKQAEPCQIR